MCQDMLKKSYDVALEKLAEMLNLQYQEIANFCGEIQDGAFSARRLKEFFKGPEVAEQLDYIVKISEEYRYRSSGQPVENATCR